MLRVKRFKNNEESTESKNPSFAVAEVRNSFLFYNLDKD